MNEFNIKIQLKELEKKEYEDYKQIKRLKLNLYINWSFTFILLFITNFATIKNIF